MQGRSSVQEAGFTVPSEYYWILDEGQSSGRNHSSSCRFSEGGNSPVPLTLNSKPCER